MKNLAKNLAKMIADPHYGLQKTTEHLKDALESRQLNFKDFSIRDLARNLISNEYVDNLWGKSATTVMESAVDSAAFSSITGQIIFSKILTAYKNPAFIGDQLVTVMPSNFLDSEKLGGIGIIADEFDDIVEEKHAYGKIGMNEEYVTIPASEKRGRLLDITREAIFADRTGEMMNRAQSIGNAIGTRREKRILDVVVGTENTYTRNGVTTNTYLTAGAYVNSQSGNALISWDDIDASEQLLWAMTDPSTGEPISVTPNMLLVPPALRTTAHRIVSSTETSTGDITTGAGIQMHGPNPIAGQGYSWLSNQWVKQATNSDSTWFHGDFKSAFGYKEIWPMEVKRLPTYHLEDENDIVFRMKAYYHGVPFVLDPRHVVKNAQ